MSLNKETFVDIQRIHHDQLRLTSSLFKKSENLQNKAIELLKRLKTVKVEDQILLPWPFKQVPALNTIKTNGLVDYRPSIKCGLNLTQ